MDHPLICRTLFLKICQLSQATSPFRDASHQRCHSTYQFHEKAKISLHEVKTNVLKRHFSISFIVVKFVNTHKNKNKQPENHVLSQLCTKTPVPAVISH